MKPKQQNNPMVLGVLGIAFALILFRIFKTLTGGSDEPLPPAKADAAQTGTATIALQAASAKTGGNSGAWSRRDPFDHPHLARLAAEEAAKQKRMNGGEITATPTAKGMSRNKPFSRENFGAALPSVAPPTYSSKPVLNGFSANASVPTSAGTTATAGTQNNSVEKVNVPAALPDPTEKWRVTAILGGSHPSAVLESPEMSPRTVRVGDELQGFRIAAIRKSEIVVASLRAVLTLPLDVRMDENRTQTNVTEKVPVRLAAQPQPQERKN